MDRDTAAVVVIVHDNGLLGAGLARALTARLGAPCTAVSVTDRERLATALSQGAGAVVLECPDPALHDELLALVGALPVTDLTGVVRGPAVTHELPCYERLVADLQAQLTSAVA